MWAQRGFTIVELLIVIVIIAVLATISYVSYNELQQRSINNGVIAAAKQTMGILKAYQAQNPMAYPGGGMSGCITADNKCINYTGAPFANDNSPILNDLKPYGTVVGTAPAANGSWYGLILNVWGARQITYSATDVRTVPGLLMYYLRGNKQQCGIEGVIVQEGSIYRPSSTGYTSSEWGVTRCWISF